MIRDAICGDDLSHEQYVFSLDYKGDTYHFCSMGCRRTFEAEPEKYAASGLSRTVKRFVLFLRSEDRGTGGGCC